MAGAVLFSALVAAGTAEAAVSPVAPVAVQLKTTGLSTTAASSEMVVPLAVPNPPAGSAVINVRVGGDRVAGTPISATGVAGVTMRLSSSETNASAWQNFPWAQCTTDAAGDCNFVVPIKTSGATDASGMLGTARPWAHLVSAPAGYHANSQVRVGSGDGTGSVAFNYRFQVAQTVVANTTYRSTNASFAFMITSSSDNDQDTSAGYWQIARDNPNLLQKCGLRFGVLVDLSGSINATELAAAKQSLDAFVDALRGTPSSVALFNFDATSPAAPTYPNLPTLRSVRTASEASIVKSSYASWATGSGTNWDAGLHAVAMAAPVYDVVVVLTDGNPTQFGTSTPDRTSSSPNRVRDIEAGVFSANLLKAKGTRVIAVGVGAGAAGISSLNLAAISGPTLNTDYFQPQSYQLAATTLSQLAKGNCEGTIDVTKRVIPASAVVPTNPTQAQLNAISVPASDWQINGSSTGAGVSFGSPAGPWTTNAAGTATIPLRFPTPGSTGPVTWTETQRAGHALQTVRPTATSSAQNAVCVNSETGASVPVTSVGSGTSTPGVSVPVAVSTAIECTIYNRQLPSSIQVAKRWSVNGTTYDNGTQPAGITAQLTLTGPGATSATTQAWGVPRIGYAAGSSATLFESVDLSALPGCVLTGAAVTSVNGQPATTALGSNGFTTILAAGENAIEVTNTVTCSQSLTLVKAVILGNASPSDWLLSVGARPGALPGPSGHHSASTPVVAPVTADSPYRLGEFGGSPLYTQVGSWTCHLTGDPTSAVAVAGGQVSVPLGRDVTCTVRNATARITLLKQVIGGDSQPADWQLTATPASFGGLTPTSVTGADYSPSGNPANTVDVRPGHPYTLSESISSPGAPLAYQQLRLEMRTSNGSWVPVQGLTVTAPSAGETTVYRFVNEPMPALSLPLTGGTPGDMFIVTGSAVLATSAVAALVSLRRRRKSF